MSHLEQAEISKVQESVGAAAEASSRFFEDSYKMPSGGGRKGDLEDSKSEGKAAGGSTNGAPGDRCPVVTDVIPLGDHKKK